ncbi:MAG: HD domain-containing protein [Synergistetes bacterium]|nr:HD domain-containing protein [Synergistota bacterium]
MKVQRLVSKLYEIASILRWNDHPKPFELTELDKQAHKAIIAYVLARFEEDRQKDTVDWRSLIEGILFELLQRAVLTDIKPQVFHKVMNAKGRELNKWVLQRLTPMMQDLGCGFYERFERYLLDDTYGEYEKRILRAAHYLATDWEFRIIYNITPFMYGIQKTKADIENQIEDHYDLIGVQKLLLKRKIYNFVDLCGQLRFQKRWSRTPRVPQTSVLGHMLVVAIVSYVLSVEMGACRKRLYNTFFAGLFHDLPEVVTRDIISPVKRSVEGMEEIIREYERYHVEEEILPLLPRSWHREMKYFIEDEFNLKIVQDGVVKKLSVEERELFDTVYNEDRYNPMDGELIKGADHLAAFTEALFSIRHGISSCPLLEAKSNIFGFYRGRQIGKIDFQKVFEEFDPENAKWSCS